MKTFEWFKETFKNKSNLGYIIMLCQRWQDEKEYEDIKEYALAFEKKFSLKEVEPTKRPFGFKFKIRFNNKIVTAHIFCKLRGDYIDVESTFK